MMVRRTLMIVVCFAAFLSACGQPVGVQGSAQHQTSLSDSPVGPLNDLGDTASVRPYPVPAALDTRINTGQNLLAGQQWYRCRTWPWQTRNHDSNFYLNAGECFYMSGPVNPGQRFDFSCLVNSGGSATIDIVYYDANWNWLRYDWSYVSESGASVLRTAPSGAVAGAVTIWSEQAANFRNCQLTLNGDAPVANVATNGRWRPQVGDSWQWQLNGSLNTGYGVDIYDIDLFDNSAATIRSLQNRGAAVICYMSAGSYENWRPDAGNFSSYVLGTSLAGWPGERWLDIRSQNVRNIMAARLDLARSKGCDAIEPDNIDGYTQNSGFSISYNDQINYNRWLANAAHDRGMSIALKNNLGQVGALVGNFDFAINESCREYSECGALSPFIQQGKAVLHAEYDTNLLYNSSSLNSFCNDTRNRGFSSLVLPRALDDSFRRSCR